MATAGRSHPSPYRRASTEIGFLAPRYPGRGTVTPALAGRRAGLAIIGVGGALCLLATACSGSSPSSPAPHGSSNGGTNTVANSGAIVSITPANGSRNVKTGNGVSVTVTH